MAQKKSDKTPKVYEVITQPDENDNVLVPLPPKLLKKLGWTEGDNIEFCAGEDGTFILRKVN
jgi:hypothetical protein